MSIVGKTSSNRAEENGYPLSSIEEAGSLVPTVRPRLNSSARQVEYLMPVQNVRLHEVRILIFEFGSRKKTYCLLYTSPSPRD